VVVETLQASALDLKGAGLAAEGGGGLIQGDLVLALAQLIGGGKAGDAAADDGDVQLFGSRKDH